MKDDTRTPARVQIAYDWLRAHHPGAEVHIQRGPDGLVVLSTALAQKQTNPPAFARGPA